MIFEQRPWGNYTVLHTDEKCQVKKLVVNPEKRISLQSHKFRAEHWFIISGEGIAELNGENFALKPGDTVNIDIGVKHRISSRGESDLVVIEVQTGDSFSEEDITRYEDDFGRVT